MRKKEDSAQSISVREQHLLSNILSLTIGIESTRNAVGNYEDFEMALRG